MSELKVASLFEFEKVLKGKSNKLFYAKADVDAAIAELNDKLKVQTSIAEEAWKMDGIYHTSYAEAVKELYEKNKELRDTKRALWLAIAMRAKYSAYKILRDAGIMFAIGDCRGWDKLNTLQKKWQRVADKCRKKAEEYK